MVPERRTAILVLLVGLCLMAAPGGAGENEHSEMVFDDETNLEILNITGDEGALDGGANTTVEDTNATVLDGAAESPDVPVQAVESEAMITAEGGGTYYFGEEIRFSGINIDSDSVYLFITGTGLRDDRGVALDTGGYAADGNYAVSAVGPDGAWEYRWDTAAAAWYYELEAGTYTIYACNRSIDAEGNNVDRDHLSGVDCQTVQVAFIMPTLSLDGFGTVLLKGDSLTISGITTGSPDAVQIWITGDRYRLLGVNATVGDDGTFSYTVPGDLTPPAGQCYLVVQHPMTNGVFDVIHSPIASQPFRIHTADGCFVDLGSFSASQAATVITDMLNSPNCDDTYIRLSFEVLDPAVQWIRIDAVGSYDVGETFTVSGSACLPEGTELHYAFTLEGETAPARNGTVTVSGTDNIRYWHFPVDSTGMTEGRYTLNITAPGGEPAATAQFELYGFSHPRPSLDGNYEIERLHVDPPLANIVAGGAFSLESELSLQGSGDHTFPYYHSLVFATGIDDPVWSYNIAIDGVPNFQTYQTVGNHQLSIAGWDLAYQSDTEVSVLVNLTGTVPTGDGADDILLFHSFQRGDDTVVAGSDYRLNVSLSETSPATPPVTSIPLSQGWNFVSTPKTLAIGKDTTAIFAGVDTAGHSIFRYDTPTRSWIPLKPTDRIRPLEGYWIYAAADVDIPLSYATGTPQAPPERALAVGWNAIGFSDTRPTAARDALLSLGNSWSVLMGFDAATQSYETSIIRGGSGEHSDAGWMLPAKGYWLYMTEDGTLAAIGA